MDIYFANRKLRRRLGNEREMNKAYGRLAGALRRRLAVLAAVKNLGEVPMSPPERCHALKGELAGYFAVDISRNWRLIFRPAHEPMPTLPDGGPDLCAITAIEVVDVTDYH